MTGVSTVLSSYRDSVAISKNSMQALFFAEYCTDMVSRVPPPTGLDSGSILFLTVASDGTVTYTSDPAQKTSLAGFFPESPDTAVSHQIQILDSRNLYGSTFTTYAITATVGGQSSTLTITP